MGSGGLNLASSTGSSQFLLKNWEEPGDKVLVYTNLSKTKDSSFYMFSSSYHSNTFYNLQLWDR